MYNKSLLPQVIVTKRNFHEIRMLEDVGKYLKYFYMRYAFKINICSLFESLVAIHV